MDIQLRAGVFKEIAAFFRTKKFIILACVFIGIACFYPLMIRGLSMFMYAMSDVYEEVGIDITVMTAELTSYTSIGVTNAVSGLTSVGLMVFLLLINSFSGGEQKHRSIIIPQNSGLEVFNYLLPKFIIFPLAIYVFTLVGVIVSRGVSGLVFDYNDVTMQSVVVAAALAGLYNMFFVCLHLTLGTSTGKAGMSAAICIVASIILPEIFMVANTVPAYNPLTMSVAAAMIASGAEIRPGIVTGVIITVLLMVAVFLIALFAQNAKKVDNKGNEIII